MVHQKTRLVDAALDFIPSVDSIFSETAESLDSRYLLDKKIIEDNFWQILQTFEHEAYERYLDYEQQALEKLKRDCVNFLPTDINLIQALDAGFPLALEFEHRAAQSRKARAGSSFERAVPFLLEKIDIICEKPLKEDKNRFKKIDFIIPSVSVAKTHPEKAIFLSIKRTIRERWRQVSIEKNMGYVYLVSMSDEHDLSEAKIGDLENDHIILYVPDEIKLLEKYRQFNNLRKISDLPKDLAGFRSVKKQTVLI
jgi:hypothetical protein